MVDFLQYILYVGLCVFDAVTIPAGCMWTVSKILYNLVASYLRSELNAYESPVVKPKCAHLLY